MSKIDSVTLRRKKLKDGRESLYLDYYTNGQREYEFLKLYLSPDKKQKEENKRVLQLAEAIRGQRLIDIQNSKHGFTPTKSVLVHPYFEANCLKKVYAYIKDLIPSKATFNDINKPLLQKLRDRVNNGGLKQNTKWMYWMNVKATFHKAEKEDLFDASVLHSIENIRQEETHREYLTLDEIKAFASVDVTGDIEVTRNMFMFSCCTGIRWCDVTQLKWRDIVQEGDNHRIIFRQQKTKGQEYMDIAASATEWLPDRGGDDELVFKSRSYALVWKHINRLADLAGIDKKISFHTARHSFACMMVDLNTDLYTISKLLGHRNIATTQIYAKIRDKQKREAVEKIPSFI